MTDPKQTGAVDVALEWPIAASVQRVWEALFQRPDAWWPSGHRALGPDSVMHFEPRIGAALREEKDGQGLAWYSVMAIEPLRSVDLVGHLAARYGGPATSLLHLELVAGEQDGSSRLKLTDSIYGRIGPAFQASTASGWQSIIGEGLVAEAERTTGD